jgi:SAM-dependent methyltransferase
MKSSILLSKMMKPFRRGRDADPVAVFLADSYVRHNQRRQEHLASLGLDIAGTSVLEVGAGIGDHTSFFLDRACRVMCTDARPRNLDYLRRRYPELSIGHLDLDQPASLHELFDIVYCYGVLYHLMDPGAALVFLAGRTGKMLLLETCVSGAEGECIDPCDEDARIPSHGLRGRGCRPTRRWVYQRLRALFPFVYMPATQPWHEEFPLDWTAPPRSGLLTRSIYIASRQKIDNPLLLETVPMRQRH